MKLSCIRNENLLLSFFSLKFISRLKWLARPFFVYLFIKAKQSMYICLNLKLQRKPKCEHEALKLYFNLFFFLCTRGSLNKLISQIWSRKNNLIHNFHFDAMCGLYLEGGAPKKESGTPAWHTIVVWLFRIQYVN